MTMTTCLRITRRVATWTALAGLSALLVVAVVLPRMFGAQVYTVLTPSMSPTLDPGTLVVVRRTDPEDIGVGSVITFQLKPGRPDVVTHRVVRQGVDDRGRPVFLTEGDANDTPDALWVRPVQVRGTVWYSLPYVGRIGTLLPNDTRELLVGGVAFGLLAYAAGMFGSAMRERRRRSHVLAA
jgi:signal peptidase